MESGFQDVYVNQDNVRKKTIAPKLSDFKFYEHHPDVIGSMVMVDILSSELDYKYRFYGTQLVNITGKELTGKSVGADLNDDDAVLNSNVIQSIMKTKAPSLMRSQAASVSGKEYTKTTLYLPISQDGKSVFGIVCIKTFKMSSRNDPTLN